MTYIPYRTGITSIKKFGRIICRLLQAFRPVVAEFLTETELGYWDALLVACTAFEENVSNPRP